MFAVGWSAAISVVRLESLILVRHLFGNHTSPPASCVSYYRFCKASLELIGFEDQHYKVCLYQSRRLSEGRPALRINILD